MGGLTREDAAVTAGAVRCTWVGHATLALDVGGRRLLTDPLLTRRVAHLRRRAPLPSTDTGDASVVLLSHAHMDHVHLRSLRRVVPTARVVAPAGTARLVAAAGFTDVVEVVPGDRVEQDGFLIETVRAAHSNRRGPHSRVRAEPVGYLITVAGPRIYFPGDTDLFDGMAALGPVDLAALPIWGWGPTLGDGHLDPGRASEAAVQLAADRILPIHWGTYAPEDGRRRRPAWLATPATRFADALAAAGRVERLNRLEPGDHIEL